MQAMHFGSQLGHISCAIAIAATSIGCGDGDTQITVKYASDYARPAADISVFGVFENGRLSPESWKEIGPALSSRFSQSTCETAWSDSFLSADPTLTSTIDEYTKDDGVTDELLERLAPMAKGSAILTFSVVGRRLAPRNDTSKSSGTTRSPSMRTGGGFPRMGGRGMRGNGGRQQPSTSADTNDATGRKTYEISASLFSIRLHHSVALVAMSYSGPSIDTALQEFSEKLRSIIPNVNCTGWNLKAHIDVTQVRELMNHSLAEPVEE